jgi:hypothetical protein
MIYHRGASLPFWEDYIALLLRAGTPRHLAVHPREHMSKHTPRGLGQVYLVQRKLGPFDFEYIAVKAAALF